MAMVFSVLGLLCGLANIVCLILVLIKMFKAEGVGKGILALICSLYAFVWGWQKNKEQNLTKVMWVWTAAWLAAMVFNGIAGAMTPPPSGY